MTNKQQLIKLLGVNPDTLTTWKKYYKNAEGTTRDKLLWALPKSIWNIPEKTKQLLIKYFEDVREKPLKLKKAYILSFENGTVQIGNTVFQPCTGASFHADRKGLNLRPWEMVKDCSMESAEEALRLAELPF